MQPILLTYILDENKGNQKNQPNEQNVLEKQVNANVNADTKENVINSVHYISWVSGIILACVWVSVFCLVPQHNVVEEPSYWYELMCISSTAWVSIFTASLILKSAYCKVFRLGSQVTNNILEMVGQIILKSAKSLE